MTGDLPNARTAEHSRARWTTYLLYACLALDLVAIASGLAQHGLLSRVAAGEHLLPQEARANDARHGAISRLQILVSIITAIVWLVWLHKAYSNLGLAGTKKSRFTSGWAVGYWFVPFVNLVRPYQIVVDLWLRSDQLNTRESVMSLARPAVISWWWGVYLLSAFAGRLFTSLAREAKSVDELINVTDVGMLADAIGIVSALLAVTVVRGVDQRQQRLLAPSSGAATA